ncbi:HNH endonuclease [Nakamurella alba]|uniref:HNH endonuclease n=1 Tax=Nakamurella alba TaxID=2665158 RepID=UPI0012B888A4|nr:DUF222 domain-containing protein [Nakamurella alba]
MDSAAAHRSANDICCCTAIADVVDPVAEGGCRLNRFGSGAVRACWRAADAYRQPWSGITEDACRQQEWSAGGTEHTLAYDMWSRTDENPLPFERLSTRMKSMQELDERLADVLASARAAVRSADDNADRITIIRWLEHVKSFCAAGQATLTDAYRRTREAEKIRPNSKAESARLRTAVATEIAAARRESAAKARQHVGLAAALCSEMPQLLGALDEGRTSEYRAVLVARAAGCLSSADRTKLNAMIGPELAGLGDGTSADRANGIAYKLDPEMAMQHRRKAVSDRRVSVRPAPDGMAWLSAFLPVAQAVSILASLKKHADLSFEEGDTRTQDQKMADELVARATNGGTTGCDADGVPDTLAGGVVLNIIMSDRALMDDDDEPAYLVGYGTIPADLARKLAAIKDSGARTWVRRLYTDPARLRLRDMDRNRRLFPESMKQFLRLRDRTCRTPWCNAPIRDADHIQEYSRGGATDRVNGQGKCKCCNLGKIDTVMRFHVEPDGTVVATAPDGHEDRSPEPVPPRSRPWRIYSPIEIDLGDLIDGSQAS